MKIIHTSIQTNILTPETPAQRMVSKKVLRVKDAPDMSLLEAVRHFTFLLSEENLQFVRGGKSKDREHLEREIDGFSEHVQDGLAKYNKPQHHRKQSSIALTADAAKDMYQEYRLHKMKRKNGGDAELINDLDRDQLIDTAKRCLAWAHNPARAVVPGTENVTNDQVRQQLPRYVEHGLVVLYICLYLFLQYVNFVNVSSSRAYTCFPTIYRLQQL